MQLAFTAVRSTPWDELINSFNYIKLLGRLEQPTNFNSKVYSILTAELG